VISSIEKPKHLAIGKGGEGGQMDIQLRLNRLGSLCFIRGGLVIDGGLLKLFGIKILVEPGSFYDA